MSNTPSNTKPAATTTQPNEGEGNKTAARHYNDATQKFVQDGKVDPAAKKAEDALDGPEADELKKAEEAGKARAQK